MAKTLAPIKPDVETYFVAKRLEAAGLLRPGQALMLAASLPSRLKPPARGAPKRGKK